MARPSKTSDNRAVVTIGGKERRGVIRWNGTQYVLLLSNHGRYNKGVAASATVRELLLGFDGRLLQN